MSRIGNRVLKIPEGVNVNICDQFVTVSNSENKIDVFYNKFFVKPSCADGNFKTEKVNSSKMSRAQFGTINALVKNAFVGLKTGFVIHLEIVGVGYKAIMEGSKLKLLLGFSHPVFLEIPKEIKLELPSSIEIKLSSFHKEILGEFASLIRKYRMPEPYKGKGIKYKNEEILRKVGKTSEGSKK